MKRVDRSKVGASVIGYMDQVDWDHELGEAPRGSSVYRSVADLKAHSGHDVNECGIVKVRVTLERVVKQNNFKGSIRGRLASTSPGLQTVSK